jgi:molybdenum cofactor cytidylyltransferase
VVTAIVLAAGESSRMGFPKALLRSPAGQIFIARIAATMHAADLRDVIVVTGRHHDDIANAVAQDPHAPPMRLVRNPDPSRGQLSSLWTGLDACSPDAEAVVVTLVDVPMLRPSTVRQVLETWRATGAPIVRPAVGMRRGHPVVFDRRLFEELRRAPLEAGARAVVSAHYPEIVNVPVDDPGCLVDVDTPQDYSALIASNSPSPETS